MDPRLVLAISSTIIGTSIDILRIDSILRFDLIVEPIQVVTDGIVSWLSYSRRTDLSNIDLVTIETIEQQTIEFASSIVERLVIRILKWNLR